MDDEADNDRYQQNQISFVNSVHYLGSVPSDLASVLSSKQPQLD